MILKLICDPMNGQRFQWRYYDASVSLWFDYGNAYDTEVEAINNLQYIIAEQESEGM